MLLTESSSTPWHSSSRVLTFLPLLLSKLGQLSGCHDDVRPVSTFYLNETYGLLRFANITF